MPHEFEIREEITVEATPEQVWAAIATGPGVNSWFMGHTEIEPGEGGRVTITMPGWTNESTITAWEPGRQLAYKGDENPDGTFMAFEYLIEGRAGGSTVIRFVHSGFLGDDWESEYDAMAQGDRMYLEKLAVYVQNFAGRIATGTVFLERAEIPDEQRAWRAIRDAVGLSDPVSVGDAARVSVEGLAPVDGVVAFARLPHWVGVRTADGFLSLMYGLESVVVEYSGFGDKGEDADTIEQAWQTWMTKTFA
jgi:uncharacterized protein YndB with AHSA1/START domain